MKDLKDRIIWISFEPTYLWLIIQLEKKEEAENKVNGNIKNYCNSLYTGLGTSTPFNLQMVQNTAALI